MDAALANFWYLLIQSPIWNGGFSLSWTFTCKTSIFDMVLVIREVFIIVDISAIIIIVIFAVSNIIDRYNVGRITPPPYLSPPQFYLMVILSMSISVYVPATFSSMRCFASASFPSPSYQIPRISIWYDNILQNFC